jgi:hypothetical protein
MQNWLLHIVATSLVMPAMAIEMRSASAGSSVKQLTAIVCKADCDVSCEPETEDPELYFDSRPVMASPAHFHGCIAILRGLFVETAEIDPLACRPPPSAC